MPDHRRRAERGQARSTGYRRQLAEHRHHGPHGRRRAALDLQCLLGRPRFRAPGRDRDLPGWRRIMDTARRPRTTSSSTSTAADRIGRARAIAPSPAPSVVRPHDAWPARPGRGSEVSRRRAEADGRCGPSGGGLVRGQPVVSVGAIPERTCLGGGPRGLQRRRRRVGVRSPTTTPDPATYRWNEDGMAGMSRRLQPVVPRPRAVEWPGPDHQGADVRADQFRGQPRRGRQGILVVPRCPAQQRLAALALPLPAGGVSRTRT